MHSVSQPLVLLLSLLALLSLPTGCRAGAARDVVLVHGFFGWGREEAGYPMRFWGNAMDAATSGLQVHESSVGPMSSSHDRACELAAQIRGAQVDYGEVHAAAHGHDRWGRNATSPPLVEGWGAERPVHFVVHSLGTSTVRCLQHLLGIDYWGWGSDHSWVASITGIASVMNGTPLTMYFGTAEDGVLRGDASEPLGWANPILRQAGRAGEGAYNFRLEHWGLEWGKEESAVEFVRRAEKHAMMQGTDNALHSISIAAALEYNNVWKTYPDTHYFSYVTEQTSKMPFSSSHVPDLQMNPLLYGSGLWLGTRSYHTPDPTFSPADWRENDGVIPSYAQYYPRIRSPTGLSLAHPVGREFSRHDVDAARFPPGQWHYTVLHGWDHVDVTYAAQWGQAGEQRAMFESIYERLAGL